MAAKKTAKKTASKSNPKTRKEVIETQDPKYVIIDGRLCNSKTKRPIPKNEPVFIVRAKDITAVRTLKYYGKLNMQSTDHHLKVLERVKDFVDFASKNPGKMDTPNT